ncbi:Tetratricopeptide domain protein [Anaeromyxobacter dehalogenans 2CP-1]|uniref:Tetratricopeptide domain protein n=1 Tax=Anaeromyxobacter dehalogenans (strain ATCC BAA-258 / DSM 21875 / 2CP-1) TaxID=455488 RepID=B8JEU8_ANAD2|nr:tetratricopeptide repeat protein [Anaeromyxobacter dehalogenans]ACL66244.1 Tetratricopeptide domain protein [Anaeromyxobacter dehalogenans 2CP-1]
MSTRGTALPTLFAVLAALAAAAPACPRAQVAAPRMVEDGDDAAPEPAPPAQAPAAPAPAPAPTSAASVREAAPAARQAAPSPAAAPPGGEPVAAAPSTVPAPAPASASASASAPASPALARPIAPVRATWDGLLAAWSDRRGALREADPARADAAQRALLAAQRDLAIENLVPMAVAEVRESRRALAANLPAEALARAEAASALAPDLPDGHLARARALFAREPGRPGPVLAALGDALAAAAREPHTARAFEGDLFAAAFAAVLAAAAAVVLVLLARSLRLFLHDFHHLPLLRGSAPVQTGFLALVLIAMPAAFGLGAAAVLAAAALVAWPYLANRERLVVTAALGAVLAMPWAAGEVARLTAWTGSVAERVYELEHGAVSDAEAAQLEAWAPESPAPGPVLAALGRHAKRRGDLDRALRLYREAAAADPRAPELSVNVGNVLFLQGDLDGAKAAYLAAQDQAGGDLVVLGAAHYGLSKLYLRTSEMDKSAAARDKAEHEAGEYLRRHGSDDEFTANHYLVDVPVPPARIAALATSDGTPEAVRRWVRARLMGALPAAAWPWGGAGFLAALWALALLLRRLGPSRACARCGRPACRRCDGGDGEECGQCVNVFARKGVVDARDRLRKEAQVRRHERLARFVTRALSVAGAGAAQVVAGAPVRGALLLAAVLFPVFVIGLWRGVMPPPYPSPYVLAGKLAVAVPLGVIAWTLAVRDAFRRTRS